MKLTLNINDDLLNRVVNATGAKTKTEAINNALSEIDRRYKLIALLEDDFGMTPDDWKNAYDENSWNEEETLRVAETPKTEPASTIKRKTSTYGRKSRPNR